MKILIKNTPEKFKVYTLREKYTITSLFLLVEQSFLLSWSKNTPFDHVVKKS